MADAIVVERLSRHFGGKAALAEVSLRISKGCVFCIAGPNGSGKTTLLNIVAGVLAPSSGRCEVMKGLKVGYAYQHPKLSEELTVGENISFFSQLNEGEEEWGRRMVEAVGVGELMDENADELSSGTMKRLEVAVALLHNPDVVLLDEPTTGLDVESKEGILQLIKLFRKNGKTVVIATHQLDDFSGVCDELVILNKGRVAVEKGVKGFDGEKLLRVYSSAVSKG